MAAGASEEQRRVAVRAPFGDAVSSEVPPKPLGDLEASSSAAIVHRAIAQVILRANLAAFEHEPFHQLEIAALTREEEGVCARRGEAPQRVRIRCIPVDPFADFHFAHLRRPAEGR